MVRIRTRLFPFVVSLLLVSVAFLFLISYKINGSESSYGLGRGPKVEVSADEKPRATPARNGPIDHSSRPRGRNHGEEPTGTAFDFWDGGECDASKSLNISEFFLIIAR